VVLSRYIRRVISTTTVVAAAVVVVQGYLLFCSENDVPF